MLILVRKVRWLLGAFIVTSCYRYLRWFSFEQLTPFHLSRRLRLKRGIDCRVLVVFHPLCCRDKFEWDPVASGVQQFCVHMNPNVRQAGLFSGSERVLELGRRTLWFVCSFESQNESRPPTVAAGI